MKLLYIYHFRADGIARILPKITKKISGMDITLSNVGRNNAKAV